jgi:hypothetical protein
MTQSSLNDLYIQYLFEILSLHSPFQSLHVPLDYLTLLYDLQTNDAQLSTMVAEQVFVISVTG